MLIRHSLTVRKHLGLHDAESRYTATQPYQDTSCPLGRTNHEHIVTIAPYCHAFNSVITISTLAKA